MDAAVVQTPFTDTITWRVVIERSGTQHLHAMRLRAVMPIRAVMDEIMALYHREQPWWYRWLSQLVVEIATIVRTCQYAIRSWDQQTFGITRSN